MNIRKTNIFIYPIEKVIFPYHEYTFQITSNLYERIYISYSAEVNDNLIGFVTRVEDVRNDVEKIEGFSRYGSLLKINKSDISGYKISSDNSKIYKYTLYGLTFARFRISTIKKTDAGGYIAVVDIFTDEISKEVELQIERKKLLTNLKKELKVYYEIKLKHHEA